MERSGRLGMLNFIRSIPATFEYSPEQEPHRNRTRELLRNHPEVRRFIGRNRNTFLVIVGCVILQLGMAFWVRNAPWWVLLLAAYFAGSYVSHGLWVLIHECAHNLIFVRKYWNTLSGIAANLPHIFPSAVSFQRYHIKHHAFQGVYDLDADLPSLWEARLVGTSSIRKTLWLLLFPFFQVARPPRLKEIRMFDRWIVLNIAVQVSFDAAIWLVLGPKAFVYLLASFLFSVGLHPLGARWIQEHYLVAAPQETYSYYGRLNTIAFNVGYHNEHHDLSSVPWNRLPKIRQAAPEMYNSLVYHSSWIRLLFNFIFDPSLNLFSRTVRNERSTIALGADVTPDIDFVPES